MIRGPPSWYHLRLKTAVWATTCLRPKLLMSTFQRLWAYTCDARTQCRLQFVGCTLKKPPVLDYDRPFLACGGARQGAPTVNAACGAARTAPRHSRSNCLTLRLQLVRVANIVRSLSSWLASFAVVTTAARNTCFALRTSIHFGGTNAPFIVVPGGNVYSTPPNATQHHPTPTQHRPTTTHRHPTPHNTTQHKPNTNPTPPNTTQHHQTPTQHQRITTQHHPTSPNTTQHHPIPPNTPRRKFR